MTVLPYDYPLTTNGRLNDSATAAKILVVRAGILRDTTPIVWH